MTFTKEQLIAAARVKARNLSENIALIDGVESIHLEQTAALIEIALASLEAEAVPNSGSEPVLFEYTGSGNFYGYGFYRDGVEVDVDITEPLYTAPPAPVVPEELKYEDAVNFVTINGLANEERGTLAMRVWNACRAALLQGKDSHPGTEFEVNSCNGIPDARIEEILGFKNYMLGTESKFTNDEISMASELKSRRRFDDVIRGIVDGKAEPVRQRDELPDGYVLVPVDMTPEQMRAVQINSELGAYTATNLTGAYSMFREFWDVAIAAAPQQEVTNG